MTLDDEIAYLRGLDLKGLRARWRSVTGRETPHHLSRQLLFAVMASRLQADVLGDLDAQTTQLLNAVANGQMDGKIGRLTEAFDQKRRELLPGTVLRREWNGRNHQVTVTREGFVWEGRTYDSLSKIASAITGTRWNGPRFFGLRDRKPPEVAP